MQKKYKYYKNALAAQVYEHLIPHLRKIAIEINDSASHELYHAQNFVEIALFVIDFFTNSNNEEIEEILEDRLHDILKEHFKNKEEFHD